MVYLFDTYQLVSLAVLEICDGNLLVNETRLVKELHQAILGLFSDNLIRELMSCLKVVI